MAGLLYPQAVEQLKQDLDLAVNDWDYLSAISGDGPVGAFEREFGKATGGKHVIACTNATSALLIALIASGIGRGDEVILPSYTWPQTLAPILVSGATPVFADIDENSVTVSEQSVKKCLSRKTRAIIVAHLFGIPADVHSFKTLARRNHCALIYDAAQGFAAEYDHKGIGAYGDFVAFSFGRSKLLSVGEGGALVCNDRELYERAIAISQHPLRMHRDIDQNEMRNHIDGISLNFRMHPLIASLALGQLRGFMLSNLLKTLKDAFWELRDRIVESKMEHVLPEIPLKATPSGVCLPLITRGNHSNTVKEKLENLNMIMTKGGIQIPLHLSRTIRQRVLLCQRGTNRFPLPRHKSHLPKSCPNTEQRCSTPQTLIRIA